MGKITVTDKIILEGADMHEWAEPANNNESRSFVNFDSSNSDLEITKTGYNKKYVTVYNSKSVTKSKGVPLDSYQKRHSKYLGKIAGDHIWLSEKGSRPLLVNSLLNKTYSTSGKYILEYEVNNGRIKVTKPDNSTEYINAQVINMLVGGAGGGGKGSYYWVDYYILHEAQEAGMGANGGCGALTFFTADMSVLKKIIINIGAGGAGSNGNAVAYDGQDSTITIGSSIYTIKGGKAGNRQYYSDQMFWSFDFNMDWSKDSNPGGSGGDTPIAISDIGIYNQLRYAGNTRSTFSSITVFDKFSEEGTLSLNLSSSACAGGGGGAFAEKPGIPFMGRNINTTQGEDGKNGVLKIWY